jgi:hypothetical protein
LLQQIFRCLAEVEWCRAQQRREPGNMLAMVGELDWISELHELLARRQKVFNGDMSFEGVVVSDVVAELFRAREQHAPLNSAHEAYAVILEELEEFKLHVWMKQSARDPFAMRNELIQIAAMALRTVIDLELPRSALRQAMEEGRIPGGPVRQADGDPEAR